MTKYLAIAGFLLFALTAKAQALICTVPNVLVNGQVIDATPVNQNFAALVNCANTIDWQNIDATGIYASQIIPINSGTATFGGSQNYTFNNALIVQNGVVVDSSAVPNSGIAGGNANLSFIITSNAGAGAAAGFKFVVSTALPSSQPELNFVQQGGNVLWQIDSKGDFSIAGGLAFDGTQPDGSSLIGGGNNLPFWLISKSSGSPGANFAFLDSLDGKPGIILENSSATVIFTVDGHGNVQAGGTIGTDNQTPPPQGIAGGSNGTQFDLYSNANATAPEAFEFRNYGGSNPNPLVAFTVGSTVVGTVDKFGGQTFGASGATYVEPTSAAFQGTVAVPTIGNNSTVCTNGSSQLIACAGTGTPAPVIQGYGSFNLVCPNGSTVCTSNTFSVSGLTTSYGCSVTPYLSGATGAALSSVAVGSGQITIVFGNVQNTSQSAAGSQAWYYCTHT